MSRPFEVSCYSVSNSHNINRLTNDKKKLFSLDNVTGIEKNRLR
jgi:helix-turn-helix protein